MKCKQCDERVTMSIVKSKMKEEFKKKYGGDVKSVGQRVNVRVGYACDCTTWNRHSKMDDPSFKVRPDRFPPQWVENYYEKKQ